MISIKKRLSYIFIILVALAAGATAYVIVSSGEIVGGIVYVKGDDGLEYLVVTSRKNKDWIFPKGKVKCCEFKSQAVLREVGEEAGVNANIDFKLDGGPFDYHKSTGKRQSVEMYALEFQSEAQIWKEKNERARKWLLFNDAKNTLGPELTRALVEVNGKLIQKYNIKLGN